MPPVLDGYAPAAKETVDISASFGLPQSLAAGSRAVGNRQFCGQKGLEREMKRISAISAVILILFSGICAFAAHPASIGGDEVSTASDLIVVKKPEANNSATTKTTYGITGTGKNGVSVAYYTAAADGTYSIALNADGEALQSTIGAAGVFYKQVSLSEGHNKFAVRAEYNGLCQVTYLDINLLKQEVIDNMNSLNNDVQAIFKGWL